MSVTANLIVTYGSQNMPEADGVAVGGPVDFTKNVAFYDITPSGTVDVVSSSASDTATKMQVSGRDTTGAIQTPAAVTLTGTTPVTGSQVFERLLAAVITGGSIAWLSNPGGAAAVGDVAVYAHTPVIAGHTAQAGSSNTSGTVPPTFKLQAGDGATVALGQIIRITSGTGVNQLRQVVGWASNGTGIPAGAATYGTDTVAVNRDWTTLPDATSVYSILQGMLFPVSPNAVTAITRCFATAAADISGGAARTYFEKVFAVNNNTATALTTAQIEIVSETPALPSGALLDMGLCTTLNDTNTCNPRQQASGFVPTGCGAIVTQPTYIPVPAPGNLPPGAAPNASGAQGIWLRLSMAAGTGTYKGTAYLRTQGTTV